MTPEREGQPLRSNAQRVRNSWMAPSDWDSTATDETGARSIATAELKHVA